MISAEALCNACQIKPADGCRHPLGPSCCPHRPLTEDEQRQDAHDSYFEAVRAIGECVKAGAPLPAIFRPGAAA